MTSFRAIQVVFLQTAGVLCRHSRQDVAWAKRNHQIFSSAASTRATVWATGAGCVCSEACRVKPSVAKQSVSPRAAMSTSTPPTTQAEPANQDLTVRHDESGNQFVITIGQDQALLQYERGDDGTVDLWHTEVPPAFRGKGVAKLLAQAALDHFAGTSTPMRLSCTYLQKYATDFPQPSHQQFILAD
ncbi:protein NATD1-like isoform X1 [Littorina saxatilis]|uniref:Protein NATD1 n=2 Tax=Littorina saxatilis TaxID=31220 RepID=A0AAN9AZ10_9CAEN